MDNSVVIDYITAMIGQVWRLFTSWEVPFIGLSPAYVLGALMMLSVVSFILRRVLGMLGGVPLGGGHLYREMVNRHMNAKNRKR